MTALATVPTPALPRTTISRLTPVYLVDRIEPCLEFWVERLGFEVRLRVESDDGLEFALLGRDGVELMYRTRDSVSHDAPGLADGEAHAPWVVLYVEVDDLDAVLPSLDGIEVVSPLKETILGTREVFLREPSGRIVALTSRD